MNLELFRWSEIPSTLKIVIADDDTKYAQRHKNAWQDVFNSLSFLRNDEIVVTTNATELFTHALGVGYQPATMVMVDNKFENNYKLWKPSEDLLSSIATSLNISIESIKIPYRDGYTTVGVMPDDLFTPSGIHFSLLLRVFGYKNQIIVVSSTPQKISEINQQLESLNKHISSYGRILNEPIINGVIVKPFRNGHIQFALTGENEWDFVKTQGDNPFLNYIEFIASQK